MPAPAFKRLFPGSDNKVGPSAQEKIYWRIGELGFQNCDHVLLNSTCHMGIRYLLNYQLRAKNYEPMLGVSETLLQKLAKYKVALTPSLPRIATTQFAERKQLAIWPRDNRNYARADFDPREALVSIEGAPESTIWSIYIPARRSDGDMVFSVMTFDPPACTAVEEFLTDMVHLATEVGAREKIINVHGGRDIRLRGEHHWDDLILTDHIKHAVKDDLEFWIASEAHYRSRHIPYRRGYLFEGPPGNGKTAVARTILSTYDFAAFSFNFSNNRLDDKDLQEAFEEAAANAPSAFLLEDIDRIFQYNMSFSRVTKEGLFNCLDGVATYSGLIVIATANHPELLDKAIRHRPGRFDVPVRFDNPQFPQRLEFINFLLGPNEEHAVCSTVAEDVAARTEKMSMAFIKLVYETAAARAFKRQGSICVRDEDMQEGLKLALSYYAQMEIKEDRQAGFAQDRRPRRTLNQMADEGLCPKTACEDSDGRLVEPADYVWPTTTPED